MEGSMRKKRVYCYYHRIDLDGHCSAAIVRRWAEEQGCEFVGIPVDHADGEEPFETFPGTANVDIGVMVDFCAPSVEIMNSLEGHFEQFIWIDHHKSAVEMMQNGDERTTPRKGLRRIGDAACELCLNYFFPNEANVVVTLLGRYDVWDKDCKEFDWEDQIIPFQLAMRTYMGATLEDDGLLWQGVFSGLDVHNELIVDKMCAGRAIQRYDKSLRKTDQQHAYRTEWEGIKCVCINSSLRGSGTLESICEPDEMMVVWRFDGKQWTIGLYSHPESDIDCGAIASEHGGGGHKNAAGFRIKAEYSPLYQFQPPGRVKELAEFGTPLSKGP